MNYDIIRAGLDHYYTLCGECGRRRDYFGGTAYERAQRGIAHHIARVHHCPVCGNDPSEHNWEAHAAEGVW